MTATTVTGTLVNPAVGALASASVTFTLVTLNDEPVAGFDAADMLETIDTAVATPDTQSGEWSIALTPNASIALFDGSSESAYRLVESSAGASATYWIIVTASADPVWVGTLRTADVAPGQPAQLPGTWCSLDDVVTFTGSTEATQSDLNCAQTILEGHIHRVWRPTDTQRRTYPWLQRACAFQTVYVHAHPELLTMMPVSSISQDGLSISFSSANGTPLPVIGPFAQRFLDAMFRGSNTTIRMNSAFQKNRLVRAGIGGATDAAWTAM